MSSGLAGLHTQGIPVNQSFTLFRNQLALGSAIPPELTSPQDIKASTTETRKCGYHKVQESRTFLWLLERLMKLRG